MFPKVRKIIPIIEKMDSMLNKNPSLKYLKLIRDIHCEINGIILQTEITFLDISNTKFALIASVEVERSFSRLQICVTIKP